MKKAKNRTRLDLTPVALIGIVIWLGILTYFTIVNRDIAERNSTRIVDQAIAASEETRYQNPIIDYATKRVYLYETGLSLPLNTTTKTLRYYQMQQNLFISLSNAVGKQHIEDKINSPLCDKIVLLAKEKTEIAGMSYVSELTKEVNGFKYIYKQGPCTLFSADEQNSLLDAVKQINTF